MQNAGEAVGRDAGAVDAAAPKDARVGQRAVVVARKARVCSGGERTWRAGGQATSVRGENERALGLRQRCNTAARQRSSSAAARTALRQRVSALPAAPAQPAWPQQLQRRGVLTCDCVRRGHDGGEALTAQRLRHARVRHDCKGRGTDRGRGTGTESCGQGQRREQKRGTEGRTRIKHSQQAARVAEERVHSLNMVREWMKQQSTLKTNVRAAAAAASVCGGLLTWQHSSPHPCCSAAADVAAQRGQVR